MKIVLASTSPKRKKLLGEILDKHKTAFDVVWSPVDEENVMKKMKDPKKLVEEISWIKAESVFHMMKNDYKDIAVIGADTIVYSSGKVFGKPGTIDVARQMLMDLQGRVHEVYTGMTVIAKIAGGKIKKRSFMSKTSIYMKPMSKEEIEWYINSGEPLDKAGSYDIQGLANRFIEKYEGEYNTIIGLDTISMEEVLKNLDVIK